jgi:outer membrane protein insertion porin family
MSVNFKIKSLPLRLFLLLPFILLSSQLKAENISEIVIEGQRRIEKDAILEKMELKKGSDRTPEKIRQDILNIFSMGYFEDVRMDAEGSKLIVRVKERPVVTKISYKGVEEFESKDLEEMSGLKPYHVLNIQQIRKAEKSIAKRYEEKGYYLARTYYKVKSIEGRSNEVELEIHVEENEKVRIRRIFFLGNEKFSSNELKQNIATSEGHAFSWATSGGNYREDVFERDLALLAFFYGNNGYIQAKFSKPRVTLSQDRRYVDIFIDVDEGPQFFLGDVSFEGQDLLFSEEDLRNSFEMKKNDVFSTMVLQEQVLKMTDKYGDEGYAFANVVPRNSIRPNEHIVDLRLDIEKGEKIYWGKVTVSGNTKTHDKVIRRELLFREGELTNATRRKKSFDNVRRLGFFGKDVNFVTSSPSGKPNVLDLEIKVEEKPTGSLNVSAGYGTATKFVFGARVGQNNLFGLAQQLQFALDIASLESRSTNLSWADPKIFDSEWYLGTNFFYTQSRVGPPSDLEFTYLQKGEGGSLRLGREIAEFTNLYGRYRLSRNRLEKAINPAIFTTDKDANSVISSVSTDIEYDSRNDRLDPSKGWYLSGSVEMAGLGGRVFQSVGFSVRHYSTLFWKAVARTNLEYGWLFNVINDDPVADSERYVLGGIQSLRGYSQGSVGPGKKLPNTRDKRADLERPYVIGGEQKVVFQQEVEFPLIPEANIRAVVFFDAGNTWNKFYDLSPAILSNYGWGLRWYSPMGPLRFEWGYPLAQGPFSEGRSNEFHFIIAPTF